MQPQKISRALIISTLERGIKDMKKDPKRTIRRLTDLGQEFAKTPLQSYVFSLLQHVLEVEDSPYYEMLEQLLYYTDEKNILTFGINISLNSWMNGEKQTSYHTPWILIPEMQAEHTDLSVLASTIRKGNQLGIHSYWIDEETPICDELYRIFSAFPDCAFFHTVHKAIFTPSQYSLLSACPNVMTILNADHAEHFETVVNLRAQGSLYGIYHRYGNDDRIDLDLHSLIQPVLRYRSAFCFLIADPGCAEQKRQLVTAQVRQMRLHPSYPVFLSDVYSDLAQIEKWLGNGI